MVFVSIVLQSWPEVGARYLEHNNYYGTGHNVFYMSYLQNQARGDLAHRDSGVISHTPPCLLCFLLFSFSFFFFFSFSFLLTVLSL